MLPKSLSEKLLSLTPDADKLTLSVFFFVNKSTGEIDLERSYLKKTVLHSERKLSYDQVQRMFDEADTEVVPAASQHLLTRLLHDTTSESWSSDFSNAVMSSRSSAGEEDAPVEMSSGVPQDEDEKTEKIYGPLRADLLLMRSVTKQMKEHRMARIAAQEADPIQGDIRRTIAEYSEASRNHLRAELGGKKTWLESEDDDAHLVIRELAMAANHVVAKLQIASGFGEFAILRSQEAPGEGERRRGQAVGKFLSRAQEVKMKYNGGRSWSAGFRVFVVCYV